MAMTRLGDGLLPQVYRQYQADVHPALRKLRDGDGGRFVPGVGPRRADVMLLGEAPGQDEAREGRPFVGAAGRVLDGWLAAAGMHRETVFITNSVKYRPVKSTGANRKPSVGELEVSRRYLQMELGIVRPRWVVALGSTAVRMIWLSEPDRAPQVTKVHGETFTRFGRSIYVTYHPAAVLHDESKADAGQADFKRLGKMIRAGM